MRLRFLMVGLLLVAAGCGGPNFVPVSGRVTLGNRPIAGARIQFQPISAELNPGPGSEGKTDSNGRFSLESVTGSRQGALVGKHKVSITAYEGDGEIPSSGSDMAFRKRIIPDEYNVKSTLTFEVPAGGTSEANFDLPAVPAK